MAALRFMRASSVHYLDMPLELQFHAPNRLCEQGRVMGACCPNGFLVGRARRARRSPSYNCQFSLSSTFLSALSARALYLLWGSGGLGNTRMGDSPDTHRSLPVVPLIADKRYYGKAPGRPAGRSGAWLEEPGPAARLFGVPSWVRMGCRGAGNRQMARAGAPSSA
jgi:hypothetical protein